MIGLFRLDRRAPERGRVHAEGAEKAHVSPAVQMLAGAAALVQSGVEIQRPSIKRGFETDGAAAEDGDAWGIRLGHCIFSDLRSFRRLLTGRCPVAALAGE